MKIIEVIARGIIINQNKILLCKEAKEKGHYFLPGGHVEFGESAEIALLREMKEEASVVVRNVKYVGMFENTFGEPHDMHHEINIIYRVDLEVIDIMSRESHIIFEWVPLEEIAMIKFLPNVFAKAIMEYASIQEIIYLSTILR